MMQNKKLKIAITGGYASGKSSLRRRFERAGYKTYDADEVYATLLKNADFVHEICNIVGVEPIVDGDNVLLNRKAVSEVVFNNPKKLQALNEFTHSAIYLELNRLFALETAKKVVFEIPLLFESGRENEFDIVIVVLKNKHMRARYGAQRDGISIDLAYKRIQNQYNYDKIDKTEHTLIYNDSSLESFYAEVDKVIAKIDKIIENN